MIDRLFVSTSGGETSMMMAIELIKGQWRDRYSKAVCVFANTGQENEQTLEFVHNFETHYDIPIVWVEAEITPEKGKGNSHRVVNFESASRNGEPFEAMIKKYGIPNTKMPHCTRELKQRAIESYLKSTGWAKGTYDTAIGIRADEAHRCSAKAKKHRLVYPLCDWQPTTKPQVNSYWRDQPFRLQLCGYQGNCKWCWKKSLRKHMTIISENPEFYDFPERMEEEYGLVGAEFEKKHVPGYRRTFFRDNLSAKDLRSIYAQTKNTFDRVEDDAVIYEHQMLLFDLEPGDGCTEQCEVMFDEDAA